MLKYILFCFVCLFFGVNKVHYVLCEKVESPSSLSKSDNFGYAYVLFPSEIKLILLNEYGIRKFLVRVQFREQIFTYGTEMVRPVFLDEENVLSSLNKFPNKSMQ